MRTALQRIAAGALAYVVSYLLIGLLTFPHTHYLTPNTGTDVTVLEVYRAAGSPLWQAIGWFTLNAHGIPINVSIEWGSVTTANFVHAESLWFGILPGWLGLVPMAACLLVGVVVTATSRSPSPVPVSVGAYMILGYLSAMLMSSVVFAGAVGPVTASARISWTVRDPSGKWLLLVVLSSLVFGSLGAFLGRSPVLKSRVENVVSELSPR